MWCYWMGEFGFTSKFNYYYTDCLIVDQYMYLNAGEMYWYDQFEMLHLLVYYAMH